MPRFDRQIIFRFNLGAYMCQGTNIGGTFRDISSLIVQDEPTPSKRLTDTRTTKQIHFLNHSYYVLQLSYTKNGNSSFSTSTASLSTNHPPAVFTIKSTARMWYPARRSMFAVTKAFHARGVDRLMWEIPTFTSRNRCAIEFSSFPRCKLLW